MAVLHHLIDDPFCCLARLFWGLIDSVQLGLVIFEMALVAHVEHTAAGGMQYRDAERRPPAMEFVYPLLQDSGWGNHDHRAVKHLAVVQGGNERDQLH